MLLSDVDLRKELESGRLVLDPWDPAMLQPSSVDVRLDRFFRVFNNQQYTHIDPALQQDFAEDIVLLKLVGMNPIVVHGGGPQIDEALAKIGKKGTFIQGMRVTDEETMEVVEWVLAGQVQQDIVGLINAAGGKAVGLTGRDGGLIRARKLKMLDHKDPSIEHDVGQVGEIESIDPSVVKALQDDQFIPVISPIGFGEDNESYNINADVVAGKIAEVLKAEKLVLLTNTPGVLTEDTADMTMALVLATARRMTLRVSRTRSSRASPGASCE